MDIFTRKKRRLGWGLAAAHQAPEAGHDAEGHARDRGDSKGRVQFDTGSGLGSEGERGEKQGSAGDRHGASGQGIALVSRVLVTRDLAAGTLVQVIPETLDGKQDFYLLAERRSNRNPATEAVLRWLSSKAEPQQS